MNNNRGAHDGQMVGGFLVKPGISSDFLDREWQRLFAEVRDGYEMAIRVLGNNEYGTNCGFVCADLKKGRVPFLKACLYVKQHIGDLELMQGLPGYYGIHKIYFHANEYDERDVNIRTRNPHYGHFYFPKAVYDPETEILKVWDCKGLTIKEGDYLDEWSYDYKLVKTIQF